MQLVGAVGGAFVFGEHGEAPKYTYPQLLDLIMCSYFPVIVGATLVFIWRMTPGDLLGIGAAVAWLTGYDAVAGKVGNHFFDLVGGALGLGLMFSDYQRDHGTRINPPDVGPGSDVFRALVFRYVEGEFRLKSSTFTAIIKP